MRKYKGFLGRVLHSFAHRNVRNDVREAASGAANSAQVLASLPGSPEYKNKQLADYFLPLISVAVN